MAYIIPGVGRKKQQESIRIDKFELKSIKISSILCDKLHFVDTIGSQESTTSS